MHPAASIIVFSTLSGAGYGLAAWTGLGLLDPTRPATKLAHLLALALIAAGLASSTLHLGNPGRAWRALTQWRSSWLSREGVLAVLAFVPLVGAAALAWFGGVYSPLLGLAGALLSLLTVLSTGMIYASLRAVDAWHTRWTVLSYLAFALSSGGLLFAAFSGGDRAICAAALGALLLAWAIKAVWRRRLRRLAPRSTPATATGLGGLGAVRLFEPPHALDSYLTREMGFRVARKHAGKLWVITLAVGAALPALMLAAATALGDDALPVALIAVAAIAHLSGIVVERWLFFAEARHAMISFYGR